MSRAAAGLLLVALAAGCGPSGSRAGPRIRVSPRDPTGTYVVTAIDYHFHDAHPSRPIRLGRAVGFTNQGRNVHNVTIPGTAVDRNIRPGHGFVIDPVRDVLPEPGRYRFFCRFHIDRGMRGVLLLVG